MGLSDTTVRCQAALWRGSHLGRCSLTGKESRNTSEGDQVIMCGIHLNMADGMPKGLNGMRFSIHGQWAIRHVLWPSEVAR